MQYPTVYAIIILPADGRKGVSVVMENIEILLSIVNTVGVYIGILVAIVIAYWENKNNRK